MNWTEPVHLDISIFIVFFIRIISHFQRLQSQLWFRFESLIIDILSCTSTSAFTVAFALRSIAFIAVISCWRNFPFCTLRLLPFFQQRFCTVPLSLANAHSYNSKTLLLFLIQKLLIRFWLYKCFTSVLLLDSYVHLDCFIGKKKKITLVSYSFILPFTHAYHFRVRLSRHHVLASYVPHVCLTFSLVFQLLFSETLLHLIILRKFWRLSFVEIYSLLEL